MHLWNVDTHQRGAGMMHKIVECGQDTSDQIPQTTLWSVALVLRKRYEVL